VEDKKGFTFEKKSEEKPEEPSDAHVFCEVKVGTWALADGTRLIPGTICSLKDPQLAEARKLGAVKVIGKTR